MSNAPDKITLNECTFSDIGIFDVEGEVEYVRADLGMTENAFRAIREILLAGEYNIDELDIVEIVMEYERKTGAHIPDHWLRD